MPLHTERFTVAVLPGGTWGAAWALVAAEQGHHVRLNFRNQQDCEIFNKKHTYRRLPGITFPENIFATINTEEALDKADVLALAPRFQDLRGLVREIRGLEPKRGVLALSKGLEEGTGYRGQQIVEEEHAEWKDLYSVWTGGNIAGRIATGENAEAHIASSNWETALFFERFFGRGRVMLTPTPDVVGSEFGGAMKNIRIMAQGLIAGLGLEDNLGEYVKLQSKKEMVEIGLAHGAKRETFDGPSGDGDYEVSLKFRSRNFMAGYKMGSEGKTAVDLEASGETYEGLSTIRPALSLAQKACINVPIVEMVHRAAYP